MIYTPNKQLVNADVSIALSRNTLDAINLGQTTLDNEIKNGGVKVEGNKNKLQELFSLLVTFNPSFNIVTPVTE